MWKRQASRRAATCVMAASCQLRKSFLSASALLIGLWSQLFKSNIYCLVSLFIKTLPSSLWWIHIPTSESYSGSFTKMVQILKFTIALWGKPSGELQQSGNLKAYESNVGKKARGIAELPPQPRWSQWAVTNDVQFPSVLQGVASS